MKNLIYFLQCIALVCLLSCNVEKRETKTGSKTETATIEKAINKPPKGYEALFNGIDFNGWNIIKEDKESDAELFSIENGIIRTYKDLEANTVQPFGELITENEYDNFILSLEYKWGDKKFKPRDESVRDAGILFHAFDEDVFWASGAECQIQEGDTGDLWLIAVQGSTKLDSGNAHYSPNGKTFTKGGDLNERYNSFSRNWFWEKAGWNKVELEVQGDKAKFMVNGKLVNEVFDLKRYHSESQEWKPLNKGKILLQAEGAEIFYRNIYIKKM